MYKLNLEKAEECRIQVANILWTIEKNQENSRKASTSASLTMLKPLTVWITQTGKFLNRWEYQTAWPAFWETYMYIRKQQLELDMEEWTCSKLGKENKSFAARSSNVNFYTHKSQTLEIELFFFFFSICHSLFYLFTYTLPQEN